MQGFGRTHRSNQVNAPNYRLVSTNLEGQKRFISSIARRLNQLGALTRGQREAATNGLFDATDNLEDDYAKGGLKKLYEDIVAGKVEGISLKAFTEQTGLRLVDDTTGQLRDDLPPITRFLNRLLSLTCAMQNRMFTEFSNRHREAIEHAINAGTFDTGVETKRAERVKLIRERLHPKSLDDLKDKAEFWAINTQSGFIWAGSRTHNRTDARTGDVLTQFRFAELGYRLLTNGRIGVPMTDERKAQIAMIGKPAPRPNP